MTIPIRMSTELGRVGGNLTLLMRILQFGDSMLPVGSFSFSNGLESAIQTGIVHDVHTLHHFVLNAVHQAASTDGVALLQAHRAALAGDTGHITRADHALFNRKMNEELRLMSVRMGKKLAELGGQVLESPLLAEWLANIKQGNTPGTYAVGMGIIFAELGQSDQDAFAVQQYGAANMILGAALRLLKVNHLETQKILFQVSADTGAEYARIVNATLEDMATFSPILDILAAVHVKAHVRMFMN